MPKKFYAVRIGRVPGVYLSWDQCKKQTHGFPRAEFKSFPSAVAAQDYIGDIGGGQLVGQKRTKSEALPPSTATEGATSSSLPAKRVRIEYGPAGLVAIYTDGSCSGNQNVASSNCAAGWAAVAVSEPEGRVLAELFGPVVTPASVAKDSALSPFDAGAEHGSNNTGELCGILEALLWATTIASPSTSSSSAAPSSSSSHLSSPSSPTSDSSLSAMKIFEIRYDSEYAAKVITGAYRAAKNVKLVEAAQKALQSVRSSGATVRFKHVKGHSGDIFNDRADELAKCGAQGSVCKIGRWELFEKPHLGAEGTSEPLRLVEETVEETVDEYVEELICSSPREDTRDLDDAER